MNFGALRSIVRHGDSRQVGNRTSGACAHPIRRDDGGVTTPGATIKRKGALSSSRPTILLNLALAPLIWEAVTRINFFRQWEQEQASEKLTALEEPPADVGIEQPADDLPEGVRKQVAALEDGGEISASADDGSSGQPGETSGPKSSGVEQSRNLYIGHNQIENTIPDWAQPVDLSSIVRDFYGSSGFTLSAQSFSTTAGGIARTRSVGAAQEPAVRAAAPNEAPTTGADSVSGAIAGKEFVIPADALLRNDLDRDGDALKLASVEAPEHGTVSLNLAGDVVFTPDEHFNGVARFTYAVSDGRETATGEVEVEVEVTFTQHDGNWWAENIDLRAEQSSYAVDSGRGNDTIHGSDFRDKILAGEGDDIQNGEGGNDDFLIDLGHGFDQFSGGGGYDTVKALADNVSIGLKGSSVNAVEVFSADGHSNVSILGTWESQEFDFSDVFLSGIAHIDGAIGNDTITGSQGDDVIIGGRGDDDLFGADGDDDFLVGLFDGQDTFDGGAGFDRILASEDSVSIGLRGDFDNEVDSISSNGHQDVRITGNWQANSFDFSDVVLDGIAAIDLQSGHDTAVGSAGSDTFLGGAGNDVLTGLGGADTFVFGAGDGNDTITDFGDGADVLRIEGVSGFSSFADVSGALSQSGSDTLLDLGPGQSVLFENAQTSAFTQDHFDFA